MVSSSEPNPNKIPSGISVILGHNHSGPTHHLIDALMGFLTHSPRRAMSEEELGDVFLFGMGEDHEAKVFWNNTLSLDDIKKHSLKNGYRLFVSRNYMQLDARRILSILDEADDPAWVGIESSERLSFKDLADTAEYSDVTSVRGLARVISEEHGLVVHLLINPSTWVDCRPSLHEIVLESPTQSTTEGQQRHDHRTR